MIDFSYSSHLALTGSADTSGLKLWISGELGSIVVAECFSALLVAENSALLSLTEPASVALRLSTLPRVADDGVLLMLPDSLSSMILIEASKIATPL